MAKAFKCNLCCRDLRAHCFEGRCSWWKCTNRARTAGTYDLDRGVLVYEDGHMERLGSG
jgi:hypothetical protein